MPELSAGLTPTQYAGLAKGSNGKRTNRNCNTWMKQKQQKNKKRTQKKSVDI
jgi:hypothetical protein